MATVIELGIIVKDGAFPTITAEDRDDARELVRLLTKLGVPVNLRETGVASVAIDGYEGVNREAEEIEAYRKPDLYLDDPLMERHEVNEDLVWGLRSYINEAGWVQYASRVTFRLPGDPRIVSLYESRVADPAPVQEKIVAHGVVLRLVQVLTSESRRRSLHALKLADQAARGDA